LIISAVTAFAGGTLVARLTGRNPWVSDARQILGGLAASATYLIGKLVAVSVS
jgi:VIT1/CCC1 family predicted Fe2+/Mn2+ transporter